MPANSRVAPEPGQGRPQLVHVHVQVLEVVHDDVQPHPFALDQVDEGPVRDLVGGDVRPQGHAHLLDRETGDRTDEDVGQRAADTGQQSSRFETRRVAVRAEVGRDEPALVRVSQPLHPAREQHPGVGQQHLPHVREVLREEGTDLARVPDPEALDLVVGVL